MGTAYSLIKNQEALLVCFVVCYKPDDYYS